MVWSLATITTLASLLHPCIASAGAEATADSGGWFGAIYQSQANAQAANSSNFPSVSAACAVQANAPTCVLVNVTINMTVVVGGVVDSLDQSLVLAHCFLLGPLCEAGPDCESGEWMMSIKGSLTLENSTVVFASSMDIRVRGQCIALKFGQAHNVREYAPYEAGTQPRPADSSPLSLVRRWLTRCSWTQAPP